MREFARVMRDYGCRAIIMEGPNKGARCGEDCEIVVHKDKKSKRFEVEGSSEDIFMFPHTRKDYCSYHQRMKDKRITPFFSDSLKGFR